ncbi:MAG: nucleotidyltransferase family protein [Chloroflexota bacterium]
MSSRSPKLYVEQEMSLTVASLPPVDLVRYRKALKNRIGIMRCQADSRFQKASDIASRAAIILKRDFGVKKVLVFGSLVHPHLFHAHSDIDLAVWGLTGRDYYRAVGILQGLDPDISVDIIAFEEASKSMQETILREGKEI